MNTPRLGHQPIEMHLVASLNDIRQTGDFLWLRSPDIYGQGPGEVLCVALPSRHWMCEGERWRNDDGVLMCRPHGFSTFVTTSGWTIDRKNSNGAQWSRSGPWESCPTLHPSLHAVGEWHGWVQAGQLVEA